MNSDDGDFVGRDQGVSVHDRESSSYQYQAHYGYASNNDN